MTRTQASRRRRMGGVLVGVLIGLLVLWSVLPLYWLVTVSLENLRQVSQVPLSFYPPTPTLNNYLGMFLHPDVVNSEAYRFLHALRNSLFASVATTIICVFLGSATGYVLARYPIRGRDLLSLGFLATNLLPQIALVVPFYVLVVVYAGFLYDTNWVLILLYTSFILGFVVWVMRGYFASIPKDLEDAARIDGAGWFTAYWRIALPLAAPGLFAVSLLSFLLSWDQFLLPLVFAPDPSGYNLPFFIYSLNGQYLHQYNEIAAGGVLTSIPPVLIVLLFGRYIVSGLTAGGVKG
ncbi:MAG: carbohydrate ABC transporter permease [Firmicutes bacterium]|nr:carbohydrate ABC transporter permease [Bacillota bacterium]